jgi:hypothetical protein
MKDANVMCVSEAISCCGVMAKSMRAGYSATAKGLVEVLLDKFKVSVTCCSAQCLLFDVSLEVIYTPTFVCRRRIVLLAKRHLKPCHICTSIAGHCWMWQSMFQVGCNKCLWRGLIQTVNGEV